MSIQNIVEADGVAIALTGMLIVAIALSLICVFIDSLPRVLKLLSGVLPPEKEALASPSLPSEASAAADATVAGDEQLAAAIGFAMHRKACGRPPSP